MMEIWTRVEENQSAKHRGYTKSRKLRAFLDEIVKTSMVEQLALSSDTYAYGVPP